MTDNTRPQAERQDSALEFAGSDGEDGLGPLDKLSLTHTSSRLGRQGLRHELAKRKYNKYSEARYERDTRPDPPSRTSTSAITRTETEGSLTADATEASGPMAQTLHPDHASRLRRGGRKVKGLIKKKKKKHGPEGDVEVDILYENQRGAYFFGTPIFSSQSLLNFDPPAWLTADGKPSGVSITNAQVPDPSWEWDWSNWYVDMSQDVDEQGWQYSFMFQNQFPWHGTHPWYHSYVRRRRWVRRRVRKHRPGHDGRVRDPSSAKEAHKLNSDYFTIHPANKQGPDVTPSAYSATLRSGSINMLNKHDEEQVEEETDEVDTIGTLIKRLKRAEVDREKVKLILRFMDEGGQDIFYLAGEMHYILSMLMFQYSRRYLLSAMMRKIDDAERHRQDHLARDEEESESERQRIDNLLQAVEAADHQIQHLEFWSDIRDAVNRGESHGAVDKGAGWQKDWEGLDSSGPRTEHTYEDSPINNDTIAQTRAKTGVDPEADMGKGKARAGA